MPFENLIPRALTVNGIQRYAPSVSGVYGITNAHEWIHIGQTDDIREALSAHLRNDLAALMVRQPVGFVFEACSEPYRTARQARLSFEYGPTRILGSPQPTRTALQRRQHGT